MEPECATEQDVPPVRRRFEKASKQLRREGERYVKEFDLQGQYDQAASEVDAAEAELRAARWGLDAAEKGQQIADIYETIGKLQVEIATLNQQVSNLMLDATKAEAGAADKALVLATRPATSPPRNWRGSTRLSPKPRR